MHCLKNILLEDYMKRIFPVLALIIIAIFLCGCPQNPAPEEPPTFTDGKIHITNNVNRTVYLKLAAIDTTKQKGQEGYRTIVSDTKSLQQGKTIDLDFDFSKFKDKRVQVMFSSENDINDDSWGTSGYRNSYLFYYQTTSYSIELVSEGEQKGWWTISEPEYSAFDFTVEEELCKIPVTNNTGYTIWSQFLAFDDNTENNPHPMSKKVKIEPGQTVEISYGKYDDYADKEKTLFSIWQHDNYTTWNTQKRWTADAEHPENIIVK